MKVYRIAQDVGGMDFPIGPYHYWNVQGMWSRPDWYWEMNRVHNDDKHATPQEEGIHMLPFEVSAFATELQLLEWFDGWTDQLHNEGFKVYEYEVDSVFVRHCTTQVVVNRYGMRLRNCYSINPE